MKSIKRENHIRRQKRNVRRHKRSMLLISTVILMLVIVVSVNGVTLRAKSKDYKAQEVALAAQIKEEKARSKEVEELRDYVGTDEYIESVAKEKLGLAYKNEILFKAEE